MVKNHCEFTVEGGVYCGNKASELVIDYIMKKSFCVCRKHSFGESTEHRESIKLNKFVIRGKHE